MCVIIVKPAGVNLPSDEVINAAFRANPHGCGLVSPTQFYKGLSLVRFKQTLAKVSKEEPCIIHFRLATHGSISRKNCHPFRRGNVFFAHNGILDIATKNDMTDSETAFLNIIYPAIRKFGYDSAEMDKAVNSVIGCSKFAFLYGDKLRLYGHFIKGEEGLYFSNLRFQSAWYHALPKHKYSYNYD